MNDIQIRGNYYRLKVLKNTYQQNAVCELCLASDSNQL